MRRFGFLALGAATALVCSTCSNGPNLADGGIACSAAASCPQIQCNCPSYYQGCVDGVCATTCPAVNRPGGAACSDDCYCASGLCALDTEACCASLGQVGSGGACTSDCDCVGQQCSGNSCT